MRGRALQQGRKHIALQAYIRVDYQKPVTVAMLESLVVVCAETQGLRVSDDFQRESYVVRRSGPRLGSVAGQYNFVDGCGAMAGQIGEQSLNKFSLQMADNGYGDLFQEELLTVRTSAYSCGSTEATLRVPSHRMGYDESVEHYTGAMSVANPGRAAHGPAGKP